MKLVTEKDEMMRRYLLDQMSDEELNRIEEKFLEDDNFFEEIAALEDELYLDYKAGNLSDNDKIAFEKKFLATSQDIEKAGFAEAFLQATQEISTEKATPSLWQSVVGFFDFSNASFRLGTALASILLLFLIGFLVFNNFNNANKTPDVADVPEIINAETPTPNLPDENLIKENQKEQEELQKKLDEEKQKREQDANKIREIEQQKEILQREMEANRNKDVAPKTEQKTFIALVLSPLVRGNGKMPRVSLTPETKTLNLTLPIGKGVEAENVKIVVRNVNSSGLIFSTASKLGKRKSLLLSVPAKSLKRGDYEVVLINPADGEELDSYYFSVEK